MTEQDKPNFLWISNLDSSAWNYGCYGDQYTDTPNIDRLAAEGVRYTNAFTAGPEEQLQRRAQWTARWHRQSVGIGAGDEKNRPGRCAIGVNRKCPRRTEGWY